MVFNNTVHQRCPYERYRLLLGKVFLTYSGANEIQLDREAGHKSCTRIKVLQGRDVQSKYFLAADPHTPSHKGDLTLLRFRVCVVREFGHLQ